MTTIDIPLYVEELHGLERPCQTVRFGVPLPRGAVREADAVEVVAVAADGAIGGPVPHQTRVLGRWPDCSAKWVLVDVAASVPARSRVEYRLRDARPGADSAAIFDAAGIRPLRVLQQPDHVDVDTGVGRFVVAERGRNLLASAIVDGTGQMDIQGLVARLTSTDGTRHDARIEFLTLDEQGPLQAVVALAGRFDSAAGPSPLRWRARLRFTAGSGCVQTEFVVHNPRAAWHPGGLWDLGDAGSATFEDLSLCLHPARPATGVLWSDAPDVPVAAAAAPFVLHQDSSGGDAWDSENHVGADGKLTVSFRGYRATAGDGAVRDGLRATPRLVVETAETRIAASVEGFWQNFPKALRWDGTRLQVGLFPTECAAPFELQGGEQKRHVVWLDFAGRERGLCIPSLQQPLRAWVAPAAVERSRAVPWFVAEVDDPTYLDYVGSIVGGPRAFAARREQIDEYGWRNFGELYADHEAVRHSGPRPMVSHYNNQYDFVYGACVHWLRTGDPRWRELLQDAARHVIDVDVYHTHEDRNAFNGGLFWHTDHHLPAQTATHRTYSRKNGRKGYGGGPSNEHNYTSGLLHWHWLTGDPEAANTVRELADWVIAMDDGRLTLLGVLDGGPTGTASRTVDDSWHRPGRGAGNSINALLDAWQLTMEPRYLSKAEVLIRRCIHPADDVPALGLDEPEYRWSYLVFLQVLGKYLLMKREWGQPDYMYHYARESLLAYARWMHEHEVPYKDALHKVLIPTETWPAHDVRKAHVLHVAAGYAPPDEAARFRERASFFQRRCLEDVLSFSTAYVTRPLVILCVYGYIDAYFRSHPDAVDGALDPHPYSFGAPVEFVPQRARVRGALDAKWRLVRTGLQRIIRDRIA
jgi:hypothetical protein